VVGGTARGRPLKAPPGHGTRPTSDRVREAVFDMLASLGLPGGARVLDLFAGSGALGIEAVSRGATGAVLVDRDPAALAALRANCSVLGPDARRVEVVRADAFSYTATAPPFDLVFADPPYGFDGWDRLFGLLRGRAGLVAAEAAAADPVEPGPGWETVKARRYGGTVVLIARPAAGED
jgi:16S rRNA (guanine966-N2)-methyltransferase